MLRLKILAFCTALTGLAVLPAIAQTPAPAGQTQSAIPDTGVKAAPSPVAKPRLHKHVHHHAARAVTEQAGPPAKH